MRCLLHALSVAVLLPALCACATVNGPERFQESGESLATLNAKAQYGTVLSASSNAPDDAARARLRDEFVAARLAVTDIAFLQFAGTLSADKKTLDAVTEGVQLTLSIAATLVSGAQSKENLAAALALITGGKATVDKHYFNNQAVTAILSTMVALRKECFAAIYAGLQSPIAEYPLVRAHQDLLAYESAGTMEGAVLSIQAEASARDRNATEKIDQLTDIVRNVSKNLSPDRRADKAALTRSLDPKKLTSSQTEAALRALGQTRIPPTLEEQVKLLRFAVIQARTDDKVEEVAAAFRQAGLVP